MEFFVNKIIYISITLLSFSFLQSAYKYDIAWADKQGAATRSKDSIDISSIGDNQTTRFSVVLASGHGECGDSVARTAAFYYQYLLRISGAVPLPGHTNYSDSQKIILNRVNDYLLFFYRQDSAQDKESQLENSGTTLGGYVLDGNNAHVFNVGNSHTIIVNDKDVLLGIQDKKSNSFTGFGFLGAKRKGSLSTNVDTKTVKKVEGCFIITASQVFWTIFSQEDAFILLKKFITKHYKSGMDNLTLCKLVAADLVSAAHNKDSKENISVIVTYVSKYT